MNVLFTALMLSGVTSSPEAEDLESIGTWNADDRPTINDFFNSNGDANMDERPKNVYSVYSDDEETAPTLNQPVYFPPMETESSYPGIHYPLKPKEPKNSETKGTRNNENGGASSPAGNTVGPRGLSPTDF